MKGSAIILFLGAEVNAYIAGVRVTPHDLVTMVHIMTGSLPRRVQAGKDGEAASRQDGEPEESIPKNEI